MTSETDLVLTLCRTPVEKPAQARARMLIHDDIDWKTVYALAESWEVEPVLYSNLTRFFAGDMSAKTLDAVTIRERDSRARSLAMALGLADLANKFERAGISVIVLKGPAVGVMAYGDASMRTFQDFDLLVIRDDLQRARDLMLELGYKRDYEEAVEARLIRGGHALEFSGRGSRVEVHSTLLEAHLGFNIGTDTLWTDAVTIQCAGSAIRVLDRVTLLLFLCAHGAKHEWGRLRWICDVAQLVDRMSRVEANEAVRVAEKANAKRILAVGLCLARDVVGQDLSNFAAQPVLADKQGQAIANSVKLRLGLDDSTELPGSGLIERADPSASSLLFWSRSRERFVDRVMPVARVIFVPTEKDEGLGALAWIGRPARLAFRFVRKLPGL